MPKYGESEPKRIVEFHGKSCIPRKRIQFQTFRRKVPKRLLSFIDSLVRGSVRLLGSSLDTIGNGVDMFKESN